jgi:hypothetical protein
VEYQRFFQSRKERNTRVENAAKELPFQTATSNRAAMASANAPYRVFDICRRRRLLQKCRDLAGKAPPDRRIGRR